MSAEQLARSSLIFEEALDLDQTELTQFLDNQCGGDAEVRSEVERLLTVHRSADPEFLEALAGGWLDAGELHRGEKLGRYEIEERIGAGGMSVVYRALDSTIGRRVAVKLLRSVASDAQSTSRFFGELRMLGALQLESIVRVYDFGQFRGLPFIIMEYLEGEDLSKAIAAHHCETLAVKLGIARQLAVILRDVHAAKIVHRDLKPANVFLEPSGRVKLMDFGMAREDRQKGAQASLLMGTPEYIAPDQLRGETASFLSDIYSYGILLFELFTGTRPYEGNLAELLHKVVTQPVPLERLNQAGAPRHVVNLIEKATAKDPARRIQNFESVLAELDREPRATDSEPPSRFSPIIWGLVAAALLMAGSFPAVRYFLPETKPAAAPASPAAQSTEVPAKRSPASPEREVMRGGTGAPPPKPGPTEQTQQPRDKTPPKVNEPRSVLTASVLQANARKSPESPILSAPSIEASNPPESSVPAPLHGLSATVAVAPPPATPVPSVPADPHAQDTRDVLAVLERYAQAWRGKDLDQIHRTFPGASLRPIRQVFEDAVKVEFQLTAKEPPRFSGSDPLTARVRCLRTTRQYVGSGQPRLSNGEVTIALEKAGASWHILSIE